jgi:Triphosphoribosyl-dephospho-CoA synthetase
MVRLGKTPLHRLAAYLSVGMALEVSAYPKPGNVHRLRDFRDTKFEDFIIAATFSQHHFLRGILRGVRIRRGIVGRVVFGDLIRGVVRDSIRIGGGGNTSLGTSLLLTPLSIALGYLHNLDEDVGLNEITNTATELLQRFSTSLDTVRFYEAIRIAKPGDVKINADLNYIPQRYRINVWDPDYASKILGGNVTLWEILHYSAVRDMNSNEVVSGYPRVLNLVNFISSRMNAHGDWNRAVVEAFLMQLSREYDTFILKKHGVDVARYVSERARELFNYCLSSDWHDCYGRLLVFDHELHLKNVNPGSTADLIATAISLYALERGTNVIRR